MTTVQKVDNDELLAWYNTLRQTILDKKGFTDQTLINFEEIIIELHNRELGKILKNPHEVYKNAI